MARSTRACKVTSAETETALERAPALERSNIVALDFDTVKTAKARKPSAAARDENGKVIRTGKNLSGNQPFRQKIYALTNLAPELAVRAAPMQVQLILKYMADYEVEGTGKEIVEGAIAEGYLKTKIDPPVLFAYYRRLLEKLGVEHIA